MLTGAARPHLQGPAPWKDGQGGRAATHRHPAVAVWPRATRRDLGSSVLSCSAVAAVRCTPSFPKPWPRGGQGRQASWWECEVRRGGASPGFMPAHTCAWEIYRKTGQRPRPPVPGSSCSSPGPGFLRACRGQVLASNPLSSHHSCTSLRSGSFLLDLLVQEIQARCPTPVCPQY